MYLFTLHCLVVVGMGVQLKKQQPRQYNNNKALGFCLLFILTTLEKLNTDNGGMDEKQLFSERSESTTVYALLSYILKCISLFKCRVQ